MVREYVVHKCCIVVNLVHLINIIPVFLYGTFKTLIG